MKHRKPPRMSYAKIEANFGVDEATFRGWAKMESMKIKGNITEK